MYVVVVRVEVLDYMEARWKQDGRPDVKRVHAVPGEIRTECGNSVTLPTSLEYPINTVYILSLDTPWPALNFKNVETAWILISCYGYIYASIINNTKCLLGFR